MRLRYLALLPFVLLCGCASSTTDLAPANTTKRIALTYDDAPRGDGPRYSGEQRTQAFLAQLEEAETGPVAMFVTTRGLDEESGRARINAYADAGHRIANHTHTHPHASSTSTEEYIAEIDLADTKLEGFNNRRPWFRFPYLDEGGQGEANQDGEKRDALRAALDERGLISGYVTVDTHDWYLEGLWADAVHDGKTVDMDALSDVYSQMVVDAAEHYDALAQRVLNRRPVQILLLHENDLAASFTVDLVNALRDEGWTIVDPDEAFSDPLVEAIPETLFSGMGRISALAVDAGLSGSNILNHWSVSRSEIEANVTVSAVFQSPSGDEAAGDQ